MSASNALSAVIVTATQSTAKLAKALADFQKLQSELGAPVAALDELINQIAQKQADLSALEVQFAEAKRSKEVQFDLDLKANALAKVSEVLSNQGKVAVDSAELTKLRTDLQTITTKFEDAVADEVNKAKGQAQAQLSAALKQKDLELAAQSAEVKAQVNSLNEKNQLLTKQVQDLQAQIAADRDARVKEAQARGNAVVNVQSGK